MSITIIGVNHKSASVDIREKVSFSPDIIDKALQSLLSIADEGLILSTCNRTEIYATSSKNTNLADELLHWIAQFHHIPINKLTSCSYCYQDKMAITHLFRVACGLDSMVLGEPQILGQLKISAQQANTNKALNKILNRLIQQAFNTAKKVRTHTEIGANAISIAYAAVSLSKRIFSNLEEQTALLVGAGETIELVGNHLITQGIKKIIIANRSYNNAKKLADTFNGEALLLTELSDNLHRGDIIISSTASPLPIIGKGSMERALRKRRHKPVFIVDIAIPRDVEPEIAKLDDAYLYTVDDLQSVIEENLQSRYKAAEQAEIMIKEEVKQFVAWQQAQQEIKIIQQYRQNIDEIKQETLKKALTMINKGKSTEDTLHFLAHTLTNKLSHAATSNMHKAAYHGNTDLLSAARKLLNLDHNKQ